MLEAHKVQLQQLKKPSKQPKQMHIKKHRKRETEKEKNKNLFRGVFIIVSGWRLALLEEE